MANITMALPDDLLKLGRKYAQEHHISLNGLIRLLLSRTVRARSSQAHWEEEVFRLMDQAGVKSRPWSWKRNELYDV